VFLDPKPELKNFKLPKPGEKKEDAPKPLPTPAQTQNIAAIQKPPTNTSLIDMEETVQSISKPQNNLWNTPFQQQPPPQEQQSPANVNICTIHYLNNLFKSPIDFRAI